MRCLSLTALILIALGAPVGANPDRELERFADLYAKFEDPDFRVDYYARNNQWRKAKLIHEDQTYKIRIKAHGKNPSGHRVGKYISYAVKLMDGEELFGFRRFSLIVRKSRRSPTASMYWSIRTSQCRL